MAKFHLSRPALPSHLHARWTPATSRSLPRLLSVQRKLVCIVSPDRERIFSASPNGRLSRTYSGRLWDTHDTQRTLCSTAVTQPAVRPRCESPQDSQILVFQLALSSRHSTRTRRMVFDRSNRSGQSPIFDNNLRTPAFHWFDGDARKRHRGQSDTAADNFRMLREKLNQPQCRI